MICGVDEAGKGAVLGPLVIAGVCCDSDEECRELGARDSKTLSPDRREALYEVIRGRFPTAISILDARDVDRALSIMTINERLARAHAAVLQYLRPDTAYVDACDVNAARHGRTMRRFLVHKCVLVTEHKADDLHPVVGAASIIAKVVRDREMAILRSQFGPLGSGYPSDPETRRYLEQYIADHHHPPPFARRSWQTVAACLRSHEQTELSEF